MKANIPMNARIKRCMDVIEEVEKVAKEKSQDPIYWEHVDRYVIDQMGLPFEREEIDLDGEVKRREETT